MSLGPLMLDIQGTALAAEDLDVLKHPCVGGLILFARNYESPSQLRALVASVRALRPELVIAVDQEGGRVQRFREGFTRLPPMAALGALYRDDAQLALQCAECVGWLLAAELISYDIDLSFAPVLDLNRGICKAVGDRSFAAEPEIVVRLAKALISGMHAAGMICTGKHFPGHGAVDVDSHEETPRDPRGLDAIECSDMIPFVKLRDELDAVMPAHIVFPQIDPRPAVFSPLWIQDILRGRLGFKGLVFSDDLSMEGAGVAGNHPARAQAALDAGCDMILVCNNRAGAVSVIELLQRQDYNEVPRLQSLRHKGLLGASPRQDPRWQLGLDAIGALQPYC